MKNLLLCKRVFYLSFPFSVQKSPYVRLAVGSATTSPLFPSKTTTLLLTVTLIYAICLKELIKVPSQGTMFFQLELTRANIVIALSA